MGPVWRGRLKKITKLAWIASLLESFTREEMAWFMDDPGLHRVINDDLLLAV